MLPTIQRWKPPRPCVARAIKSHSWTFSTAVVEAEEASRNTRPAPLIGDTSLIVSSMIYSQLLPTDASSYEMIYHCL
jgi:hypothetical protein